MKKKLLFTLFSLMFFFANAQYKHQLSFLGGVSAHTLLLEDNNIAAIKPIVKPSFALGYTYSFNDKWSIGSGVNYVLSQVYVEAPITDDIVSSADGEIDSTVSFNGPLKANIYTQFLEVPLYAQYTWKLGEKSRFSMLAGGYAGYLLTQRFDAELSISVDVLFFDYTTTVTLSEEEIIANKRFDAGVLAGFAYDYQLSDRFSIGAALRTKLGLISLTNDAFAPNEQGRYLNAKGLATFGHSF